MDLFHDTFIISIAKLNLLRVLAAFNPGYRIFFASGESLQEKYFHSAASHPLSLWENNIHSAELARRLISIHDV